MARRLALRPPLLHGLARSPPWRRRPPLAAGLLCFSKMPCPLATRMEKVTSLLRVPDAATAAAQARRSSPSTAEDMHLMAGADRPPPDGTLLACCIWLPLLPLHWPESKPSLPEADDLLRGSLLMNCFHITAGDANMFLVA